MYRVEVAEGVLKRLKRLPAKHQRQVLERIEALADRPRPQDCKKLKGMDGYRITVGEYRVLYVINDEAQVVRVYLLFQRGEGYPG